MNQEQNTMQSIREAGLKAAYSARWPQALLYLTHAARSGMTDLQTLDALAEAAYRTNTPEALSPYQNYYKYPAIASQMARAFLMLGDIPSAKEFLGYATDSALKAAVHALIEMDSNIEKTATIFLKVAREYSNLVYPEFWRALAAIADSVKEEELTRLAEQKSQELSYSDGNIHFNQALRMLGKKEYVAGWRLYEARLIPGSKNSNRTQLATIPMWEGEEIQNQTLLIFLEQGLGDLIFSLRWIQPLLHEGFQIEIAGRKPLLGIMKTSFPNLIWHDEEEIVKQDYWQTRKKPDRWVYAMSIPCRMGWYQPTRQGQYLQIPNQPKEEVFLVLQKMNPQQLPVVIVNWHGRIDTEADRTRAFSAEEFADISGILAEPKFIVSVQKDADAEEIQILEKKISEAGGIFYDAGPMLSDFSMTEAWIQASCELLTCDTSVAHLGGALGHPTKVFVRNRAIWQWVLQEPIQDEEKELGKSVWYESVQIKYAMAPQIAWMFTTLQSAINQEKEDNHTKSEEGAYAEQDFHQIQPPAIPVARPKGNFRFAGKA